MGAQYAGDPAAFPVDFLVPDDGDPPVASLGVALEALGDRTAYLKQRVGNRTIAVAATGAVAATFSTSSTADVDIPDMVLAIPAQAGDVLVIHAQIQCKVSANYGIYTTTIVDGGAGDSIGMGFGTSLNEFPPSLAHTLKYVVVNTGTVTVKGRLRVSAGADTATVGGQGYLTVQQIRPLT